MAKTKIHGEYLDPSVISGQTQVTAVGADSMLIFDATDNALKKALLSDLIETVGSTPTFSSVVVDDITLDGSTISDGGDLTIDVAGDIILDADGDGEIFLKDGGTSYGLFYNSNSNFMIYSAAQDKDMYFQGNDGGSTVNALTLDMSDAGKALFNAGANFNELVTIDGGSTANTVLALDSSTANTFLKITDSNTNEGNFIGCATDDLTFFTRNTLRWSIDSTGHLTGASGSKIVQTIASGGGNFLEVTHSGNEAWSLAVQSGSGADDYLDIGINGGTRSVLIHETGGISFNGDTASANHLDDYEEGTWTPRITSSSGTAMSGANATYTKVGRLVTVRFDITNNTGSNTTQIFGLPFDSSGHGGINIVWNDMSNEHYTGGYTSTGVIVLVQGGTASSWSFTNGNRILGFGTYFTS